MLENSCNVVTGIINEDVVMGDRAYLRTKRVIYDIIYVTKIEYADDSGKGLICFEYPVVDRKLKRRVTKKQTVGWPAVVEFRKYR